MKLETVWVERWRNFVSSGPFKVDPSITCLVGKNESGKSALLEAIYRLNPARTTDSKTSVDIDYPRWRMIEDGRSADLRKVAYITCSFLLSNAERKDLGGVLNVDLPTPVHVIARRTYDGSNDFALQIDEAAVVRSLARGAGFVDPHGGAEPQTLRELATAATSADQDTLANTALALAHVVAETLPDAAVQWLNEHLPLFFYFPTYSMISGRIDLARLNDLPPDTLRPEELTALSLLRMATVTAKELMTGEFERRRAQLEAAASDITRQVFRYWTQNKYLRTAFDVEAEVLQEQGGQRVVHRWLNIRLADQRHGDYSTNIDTRSSGFRWFFSFLAAFSQYAARTDVIVLLDEPGLSLHGRAQADFLRYLDERLSRQVQVFYTTHSPFLVDAAKLERVRLIEDHSTPEDPDNAARVSEEIFSQDVDTLFPLQGALGYDLAQNLFIGAAEHLIVEGTSDLVYLKTLSDHLSDLGRVGLHESISIVPSGGAAKVPTFVALLGHHLDVSVLVDSSTKGYQRIYDLIRDGLLQRSRLVLMGQVVGRAEADIEDLFEVGEYLNLYNRAFSRDVRREDVDGHGRILRQLERLEGHGFNHGKPAEVLLLSKADILEKLSSGTFDRFEALFKTINATLNI